MGKTQEEEEDDTVVQKQAQSRIPNKIHRNLPQLHHPTPVLNQNNNMIDHVQHINNHNVILP